MKYLKLIAIILCSATALTSCAQEDKIVGVWDVKNDYYQAVYEIVEK